MQIRILIPLILMFFVSVSGQNITQEIYKTDKYRVDFQLDKAYEILQKLEKSASSAQLPEIHAAYLRYYITKDDFKKAKYHADKAYEYSKKSNDPNAKGYGLFAQSYYIKQIDAYDDALNFAKKAQSIIENTPDIQPDLASRVYYFLYSLHSRWEDANATNHFANQAIKWSEKAHHYDILTNAFSAKSTAMEFMYNKTQNPVYQDSIKYYTQKANAVYERNPSKVGKYTYAMTSINMASIFYHQLKRNNTKSLQDSINFYLNKTQNLDLKADFDYALRSSVLGIRSQIALKNGNNDLAEELLLNALSQLKKEEKRPAYYTIINVLDALIDFYKQQNNYSKALQFSEEKQEYIQKEYNTEAANKARNLEAQYENSKLKTHLEHSQQKAQWRKYLIYALIVICVLIFSTLYFTLKNHKKKLLIEKENGEKIIAEQKILMLEKDKMEKEALISALQIEQKNEVINEIKSQLKNEPEHYAIKNTINQGERISESIGQNQSEFSDLHPQFFDKLNEITQGKLTKREIKICAYIYLGVGNKDLANIYNIEPKSIRMSKYRIKQKMGLEKDMDLEKYLKSIF